jgi:uncharacterized protein YeaO (DUF488 family)
MAVRIVRLGTSRHPDEGPRLGTVRRPPRGVPKAEFAKQDFYDVWLPLLSPSAELVSQGHAATTEKAWSQFMRKYRAEMGASGAKEVLDTLAALSHTANFAVGCYCEDESHCHRSVLRELLKERGAKVV